MDQQGHQIDPDGAASQPQSTIVGWTTHPVTTVQYVPVESASVAYEPIYAQQPATLYPAPATMMTVPSPTTAAFPTPMNVVQRQVSIGVPMAPVHHGAYYQQGQPQPPAQQQQQQQQPVFQQTQYHTVVVPQPIPNQVPASPISATALHYGPMPRQVCSLWCGTVLVAPPAVRQASVNVMPNMPAAPVIVPRLSTQQSATMLRQNRPGPLPLRSSRSFRQERAFSLHVNKRPSFPYVVHVSSDREYDGGGSSYSTSPLASEDGYSSEQASEVSSSAASGFVQRVPSYVRWSSESDSEQDHHRSRGERRQSTAEPPSFPTPKARTTSNNNGHRFNLHDKGRSILEKCRHHARPVKETSASQNHNDDQILSAGEQTINGNTSKARPEGKEDDNMSEDFCGCGIQQCRNCGLFVSQPEKHKCLKGQDVEE
ncbi:hypothetical protein SPI_02132 [Niveomyces insectorum RCEF 264]|uniref:Uncharacterized protein n=1 Tax=Niveomyces insectorum RCEF 264 TaxID=1081102 RepID=A0A167XSS3_9HYPO|nr:hypothetical protein SPI_02132 [Niveomyces insectorum RCEF 264]